MSVSVSMPQLGESVTEGTVTRWLKHEGDHVSADEPLLEVSTDKVDTEIPSPVSGILRGITVAEDETVAVGAELAVIDEDGAAGAHDGAPTAVDTSAQQASAPEQPAYSPPVEQYEQAPAQPAEPYAPSAPVGFQFADPGPHRYDFSQHSDYSSAQPGAAQPGGQPAASEPAISEPAAYEAPAYQQQSYAPPAYAPPAYQPTQGQAAEPQAEYQAPGQAYGYQVEPAQEPASVGHAEPPVADPELAAADGAESPYVTPLVRKLAAEHGIDLAAIPGTGVGGRIRKQDVLDAARAQRGDSAPGFVASQQATQGPSAHPADAHSADAHLSPAPPVPPQPGPAAPAHAAPAPAGAHAAPAQAAPAPAAPLPPAQPAPPPGLGAAAAARAAAAAASSDRAAVQAAAAAKRGTTERLSRARQVIAQRMVESLQTSAQLTTVVEADVTAIARLRDRAKAAFEAREGVKLSFLPFFALATIEALKVHPTLNSVIDVTNGTVTYHDAEHLGIAVDTERGLMVPVIQERRRSQHRRTGPQDR